jgi:tetratricopeptide (TPR) repeat protein
MKGKSIIYLQNPDLLNFSIDSQASVVSEFILGLLYYNSNDFSISTEKFRHSLTLNGNTDNKKFVSFCHLFIGNNFYKEKKYSSAIQEYKNGIIFDSSNAFIHYNLGNALVISSDSGEANNEYNIAEQINNKLINPIWHSREMGQNILRDEKNKSTTVSDKKAGNALMKLHTSIDSSASEQIIKKQTEYTVIVRRNRYGIINLKGDTIIKCGYDFIDEYIYGYKGREYFIVRNGAKFGAVNEHGNIEIPINHPTEEYVKFVIRIMIDTDTTAN